MYIPSHILFYIDRYVLPVLVLLQTNLVVQWIVLVQSQSTGKVPVRIGRM